MRMLRARSGPFVERPYYEDSEIESMTCVELNEVGLLPASPQPIRVDRFIEKRYGIIPQYEEVPNGILGFTRFGAKGPEEVVVSRSLSEEGTKVAERRMNSTLAHEAGHLVLHGHLFALERRAGMRSLIESDLDEKKRTILCRPDTVGFPQEARGNKSYDGKWWEFQANKVIGVLLLPRQLVYEALDSLLISQGHFGNRLLCDISRDEAVHRLVDVFDVNSPVARIRIEELFPPSASRQLTL